MVDVAESGLPLFRTGKGIPIPNEPISTWEFVAALNRSYIFTPRRIALRRIASVSHEKQGFQHRDHTEFLSWRSDLSHVWGVFQSRWSGVIGRKGQIRFSGIQKTVFDACRDQTNTEIAFYDTSRATTNDLEMARDTLNPRIREIWAVDPNVYYPRSLGTGGNFHRILGGLSLSFQLKQSDTSDDDAPDANQNQKVIGDDGSFVPCILADPILRAATECFGL